LDHSSKWNNQTPYEKLDLQFTSPNDPLQAAKAKQTKLRSFHPIFSRGERKRRKNNFKI